MGISPREATLLFLATSSIVDDKKGMNLLLYELILSFFSVESGKKAELYGSIPIQNNNKKKVTNHTYVNSTLMLCWWAVFKS